MKLSKKIYPRHLFIYYIEYGMSPITLILLTIIHKKNCPDVDILPNTRISKGTFSIRISGYYKCALKYTQFSRVSRNVNSMPLV